MKPRHRFLHWAYRGNAIDRLKPNYKFNDDMRHATLSLIVLIREKPSEAPWTRYDVILCLLPVRIKCRLLNARITYLGKLRQFNRVWTLESAR